MVCRGSPFHSTERPVSLSAATISRPMDAVVSDEPSNPEYRSASPCPAAAESVHWPWK